MATKKTKPQAEVAMVAPEVPPFPTDAELLSVENTNLREVIARLEHDNAELRKHISMLETSEAAANMNAKNVREELDRVQAQLKRLPQGIQNMAEWWG